MDQDFAHHCHIPHKELEQKLQVEVIHGRPIESGDNGHIMKVGVMIQDHKELLPMFVMKL
jgi:hypothetical protein